MRGIVTETPPPPFSPHTVGNGVQQAWRALLADIDARLRQLAASLPADAIVMETDAPDIPPQWLYVDAAARAAGAVPTPNTPAELPRIGAEVAALRGVPEDEWARQSSANALATLPGLTAVLDVAQCHRRECGA